MLKFLTSLLVMLSIVSCSGDTTTGTTSSGYKTAVITHVGGFDFSADSNSTWQTQDVYSMPSTIILADSTIEKIYDAGEVTLDSITSVDETKWTTDSALTVQVNYVYVIKARDGYVKFKVKTVSTDFNIGITVEYKYSTTTTF